MKEHYAYTRAIHDASVAAVAESIGVPVEEFKKFCMTYEQLVELINILMDKHFTSEEKLRLEQFYQTPLGKKTVSVMPALSADINAVLQNHLLKAIDCLSPL